MIKTIFATKNKKSGNFNAPMYYDFPKENAAEVFSVSAKETPEQGKEAVKELEVYYLGTLDTKTGVIVSDIEYIIDLGSVLNDNNAN